MITNDFQSVPHTPSVEIPPGVFPVPSGEVSLTDAASIIFPALAKTLKLFVRGGKITEVVVTGDSASLVPVSAPRMQNIFETCPGYVVARREVGTGKNEGKIYWRRAVFPENSARAIMAADIINRALPSITAITACPIFTRSGDMLSMGYHRHGGGTYITARTDLPTVTLDDAMTTLWEILTDFKFTTPADKSRAMASILSPALKMGGWIADDFPLDLAEADQSQSGKTYRHKLIQRIYNDRAAAITPRNGGVGGLCEDISTALIAGRPFVQMDNMRGSISSPILESAMRGAGSVQCRALRTSAVVNTAPFLWQLSTNGAELTRDLSNRSIITRIKKQADGHPFRQFPAGDMEAHVTAHQPHYLACVFAVLRAWHSHGCPKTTEKRHDFRGWCQSLDWIIQHIFRMPPLLDGHTEEQKRVSNPDLQWIREIIIATPPEQIDTELRLGDILGIMEDAGISFPGNPYTKDENHTRAGRILGRLFRVQNDDKIAVDGAIFSREKHADFSENSRDGVRNFYRVNFPHV